MGGNDEGASNRLAPSTPGTPWQRSRPKRQPPACPRSWWGPAIVGFGDYKYKAGSGSGGNWFLVGFSPRKQNLTLYIMTGFGIRHDLMAKLGKYSTGVSCLYIKRLADVDVSALTELIEESVERITKAKTPA